MKEFAAILLLSLTLQLQSPAATHRYLDVNASGAGTGLSWTDAYTDYFRILSTDGTNFYKQGVYSIQFNYGGGTPTNGLRFAIDPAATGPAIFPWGQIYNMQNVVVDGLVGTNVYLWFTNTCPSIIGTFLVRGGTTNATFQGLFVDRSAVTGADVSQIHNFLTDSAQSLRFYRCISSNTSGDGVSLNIIGAASLAYTNIVIDTCAIYKTGDDCVEATAAGVTITNSILDTQLKAPMFGGHPDGFQPGRSNSWVNFVGNYVHGPNQGLFLEFMDQHIICRNNVFDLTGSTNFDRGINSSSMYSGGADPDWHVENNTFYNCLAYGAINGGFPSNTVVANNLFVNCRAASIDGSVTNFFNAHTNAYYDEIGVAFVGGTPSTATRNLGLMASLNPAFVSGTDWHLTASSTAVVGVAENLNSSFTTDKDGVTRGASWDLGAYEYVPGAVTYAPIITSGSFSISGNVRFQ